MRSRAFVLVALAIAPVVATAQSSVITRPKQSAQRAVNATNAHTAAMTDTSAGRVANATPGTGKMIESTRGDSTSPNADTTRKTVTTSTGSTAGSSKKPERAQFEREVFAYERGGRRDPFVSLMTSSEIRPLLPDLRLVGVAYDPTGRNSVAVLREDAQEQLGQRREVGAVLQHQGKPTVEVPMYRVKEGQQLGRMRVARIGPRSVTFTIEEFGYSRQETLTVDATKTEKKP